MGKLESRPKGSTEAMTPEFIDFLGGKISEASFVDFLTEVL